jgi:hypothetical protein
MAQQLIPLQEIDRDVVIGGITRADIQEIFSREFEKAGMKGNIVFAFDVSYMMNFYESDFQKIKKITWATRFDIGLMKDWHRQCERWFLDQTVRDNFGHELEPIQIIRGVDKVPNEGLIYIATAILGGGGSVFHHDEIGIGTDGKAYPSDVGCDIPIDRIDIITDSPGGSINQDGATIYWVGNHSKGIATNDYTEGAILDGESATNDKCMNHSYFQGYVIEHAQGVDTINRTTSLYLCSV